MKEEQVNKLCQIRDIYRAIYQFENKFQEKYNLCLNEGMLLCTLKEKERTSTEIAEVLGLTTSNASKVIRSVEEKEFIERKIGKEDKRLMYFSLTQEGRDMLDAVKCNDVEVPALLAAILK